MTVTGRQNAAASASHLINRIIPASTKPKENAEPPSPLVISLPITFVTVAAAGVLLGLAVLGAMYLRKLFKQHQCSCPLCSGEYTIEEQIGSGGFGKVYTVRARRDKVTALQTMRKSSMGLLRWLASPFHHNPAQQSPRKPSSPEAKVSNDVLRATTKAKRGRSASSATSSGSSDVEIDKKPPPAPLQVVNGATYVLKMVPVTDINDATEAQREARDLRYLKHARIVRYVDDFLHSTPSGATRDGSLYVCIIMERCKDDLRRFIQKWQNKTRHIPEDTIVRWAAQLISALRYCHARNVCHRDVKSQNIFLSSPGGIVTGHSDHTHDDVKLGDFGLARSFDKPVTAYTEAGTDCYKSPEAFVGGKRDGRKADIWALGLVLAELMTKKFTWHLPGPLGAQVLQQASKPLEDFMKRLPSQYSPALRLLVKKCLLPDPNLRPTAEELFRFKILRQALTSRPALPIVAKDTHASDDGAARRLRHTKSDIHDVMRTTRRESKMLRSEIVHISHSKPTTPHNSTTIAVSPTPAANNGVADNGGSVVVGEGSPATVIAEASTPSIVQEEAIPEEFDVVTDSEVLSDAPSRNPQLRAAVSDGGDADGESDARSPWMQVHKRRARRKLKSQPE